MPKGCNDTLISLIPKVSNLEVVTQLRPIGLCNVTYKLLTKVMTNRLKEMPKKLIGPHQSSFVPERQITDNILVYQEALNSMRNKKGRSGWMALKVDLEKAYDRLSWEFIEDTMQTIGFNQSWRRNVLACLSTSRLAVNWNGERSEWFQPGRGIRQGDPISPLLFVLCIERLSLLINHFVNTGIWKGLKFTRQGPHISHLFFADDMVIFGEATTNQAKVMKECLDIFCKASGQKVNLQKSALFFSKNTPAEMQTRITNTLGVTKVGDLGRYLGVPSVHGRITKESFAGILGRIQARLTGWRSKTLSLAGRKVLVQSVLSAIPYYSMQSMLLPVGVIQSIEKLIRSFLWGSSEGNRKTHLVNWDTVTLPKANGGLGIRRLEEMNHAFLAKLGWRILRDENSLWIQIVKAKYSASTKDCDLWQPKRGMSNAWKGILKSRYILRKGIKKVVINGKDTLFWLDTWLDEKPLKESATEMISLPELYQPVASYWDADMGWKWQHLEHLLPTTCLEKLAATVINCEDAENDRAGWRNETSGLYSVKTTYELASDSSSSIEAAKWNNIWKLKVPSRIKVFVWLVRHNRIMTNQYRFKCGLTECDKCTSCGGLVEDTEHVIRRCPVADELWRNLLPGTYWATRRMPFLEWLDNGIKGKYNGRYPGNFATLFAIGIWWVWKWRNDVIFNNTTQTLRFKLSWIQFQLMEIDRAFANSIRLAPVQEYGEWTSLKWLRPRTGFVKVNIDGAVDLVTYHAGGGGVIRDSTGQWKGGFTQNIGICTPLEANAWAALRGIQLAISLGFSRIVLETDSRELAEGLTASHRPSNVCYNLITACKRELSNCASWHISLVKREQNRAADMMAARYKHLQRGLFVLHDPPHEVMNILGDDIDGIPQWRHTWSTSYD